MFLEWSLSLLKDWTQRKQTSSVGRTSFPPTSHRCLIRKLVPRTPTEMRLIPRKTAFLTAVDDIRCYKFLDHSQILSVSHGLLLNFSCVPADLFNRQPVIKNHKHHHCSTWSKVYLTCPCLLCLFHGNTVHLQEIQPVHLLDFLTFLYRTRLSSYNPVFSLNVKLRQQWLLVNASISHKNNSPKKHWTLESREQILLSAWETKSSLATHAEGKILFLVTPTKWPFHYLIFLFACLFACFLCPLSPSWTVPFHSYTTKQDVSVLDRADLELLLLPVTLSSIWAGWFS